MYGTNSSERIIYRDSKIRIFDIMLILTLCSLSFGLRIIHLPYKNEYFLISDIFLLILLAFKIISSLNSHKIKIEIPSLLKRPFQIFSLIIFLGSLVTLYYRSGQRSIYNLELWGPIVFYLYRYLISIIAFIIAYERFGKFNIAVLGTRFFLLSGFIVELSIIGQAMGIIPIFWIDNEELLNSLPYLRVGGVLSSHVGHVAGYIILLTAIAFQVKFSNIKVIPHWLLNLIIYLSIPAILFSGRRAGWLSLILFFSTVGIFFIKKGNVRYRFKGLFFGIGCAFIVTYMIFGSSLFYLHLNEVFDFETRRWVHGGNLESRYVTPIEYMRYFEKNPTNWLLGTGFVSTMTYVVLYGGVYNKNLGGPHNGFVTVLFELGIFGLIVFTWLILNILRSVNRIAEMTVISGKIMQVGIVIILLYSTGHILYYFGTLYGNLSVLFLIYLALSLRLLAHEIFITQNNKMIALRQNR